jgi:hypothetical protein
MPTELIRKQFLLTEEENIIIEQEAQKRGLSVSNLTRMLHGLEPLKKGFPSKSEKKDTVQRKRTKSSEDK